MKIGLVPINVGLSEPSAIVAIAQQAESVGVESVWTFEHVVVPADYDSAYPYHPSGKMGAPPETPFLDPLITLSHVAAHTKTLRLGTGVNILPQANPLLLAKQVASLDVLSAGRMLLGVGAGWLREEFDAMGVPFERRGARMDDYLEAMKKVWAGELVEHESDFLTWTNFKSYPLPVQRPHPPLIIGGTSRAALRRAARYGDGWFAPAKDLAQLAEQLRELRAATREIGRDADDIEVTSMWVYVKEGWDSLARYRDLGVTRLVIPLTALGGPPAHALDALGEHIARLGTAGGV
jgi:probable F420-dependent oxidoreductase